MRLLLSTLLLGWTAPLVAQVGHNPDSSPYRDLPNGRSLTLLYGDIAGNGGRIGIGPHNGTSYGIRADVRLGAPLQFGLGFETTTLERLIVSAEDSVANRTTGPVDQGLTMIEGNLQLNLTGRKSWHGLAPYLGGTIGVAIGEDLPAGSLPDSSGYRFGTKIYLAPSVGLRVFLGSHFHLRLDARQLFWKLKYPVSYLLEPVLDPGTTDDPHAVIPDGKTTQWTGARELRVGLGFAF